MVSSVVIIAVLVVLDQLSKYLATAYLAPVGTMPFIPGVMQLRYILNEGAAFSLFADKEWSRIFFICTTVVTLIILAVYSIKKKPKSKLEAAVVILILAGGIGNLIDRIFHGYVVDFFSTTFIEFPTFNVADCYICIGAALLILTALLEMKKEAKEGKKEPAEDAVHEDP